MSHPSLRGYSFPMKIDMPVLIRKKLLQKVGRVGERLYRGVEQTLNKQLQTIFYCQLAIQWKL